MRKVADLHPEAKRSLEIIAELERGIVPPVPIPKMRELTRARSGRLAADPPKVGEVVNRTIEAPSANVPVRFYYPDGSDGKLSPAYIYCHGGGFVVGDLDTADTVCRTICREAGVVVASVDYRLAPEHKFPAGLDDTIAVARWIAANGASVGIDASRLAIGGDSAGGNLAAASVQVLQGSGGVPFRLQVLVYPVADLTCQQPSYKDLGTGYPLTAARMKTYIDLYLADTGSQATDPRASPLLAKSVEGLPPALVIVAGLDPLVDEGLAYARRLADAGIPTHVHEVPDHPHGFIGWTREVRAAREALALIGRHLRDRLAS